MTQTVTYVGLLTDIVSRDGRMVARVGEGQSGMGKGGEARKTVLLQWCFSIFCSFCKLMGYVGTLLVKKCIVMLGLCCQE